MNIRRLIFIDSVAVELSSRLTPLNAESNQGNAHTQPEMLGPDPLMGIQASLNSHRPTLSNVLETIDL
jgi:hypothetical protein